LKLHGATAASRDWSKGDALEIYGTDAEAIRGMAQEKPDCGERLSGRLPYIAAEVAWAARNEMARTVEDVLSRRTRALLLDARASVEAAGKVAGILRNELGRDENWEREQVQSYSRLAQGYLLT
jgi:glycerol-3-phosphate dehydrogenase